MSAAEPGDGKVACPRCGRVVWLVIHSCRGPVLPRGLCGNRDDHLPHAVREGSLAPFLCMADQSEREPHRSETCRKNLG